MAKVELNSCCFWHGGDAKTLARPVTPSTAPDEGMLVIVPVGGGPFDGPLDLRLRPHLVQADYDAAGRGCVVELLDRPLLRAKSGSTRSPNQVSSRRHLRPSRMKISLIRLRRMAMPRPARWATSRSSVQEANGSPRSPGRVSAVVMTALFSSTL